MRVLLLVAIVAGLVITLPLGSGTMVMRCADRGATAHACVGVGVVNGSVSHCATVRSMGGDLVDDGGSCDMSMM